MSTQYKFTQLKIIGNFQTQFATVQQKAITNSVHILTAKIIILNSIFNDWERIQFNAKHTARN